MPAIKSEIGAVYGRLLVQEFIELRNNRAYWKCLCSCGNYCEVMGKRLRNGNTSSCGCKKYEPTTQTHGLYKSHKKLLRAWYGMMARCYNPEQHKYYRYGARGITICDEWKNDPNEFVKWALQDPKSSDSNYSIDRIDNDGNYESGNCRWASRKEQQGNMSRNTWVEYQDKRYLLTDFIEKFSTVTVRSFHRRVASGMSHVEAALTPSKYSR